MKLSTRNTFLLALAVSQLAFTYGQRTQTGSCSTPTPGGTPDIGTLVGTWYLQQSYRELNGPPSACTSYIFDLEVNLDRPVTISALKPNSEPFTATGIFSRSEATPTQYSVYSVTINESPMFPTNFIILGFGNDWLAGYSCTEIAESNISQIYIFTTTRNPPRDVINAARDAVTASGLSTTQLTTTRQRNC